MHGGIDGKTYKEFNDLCIIIDKANKQKLSHIFGDKVSNQEEFDDSVLVGYFTNIYLLLECY